jgi:hypothetical protein
MSATSGFIGSLTINPNSLHYLNLGIVTTNTGSSQGGIVISDNTNMAQAIIQPIPSSLSSGQQLALIEKGGLLFATGGSGFTALTNGFLQRTTGDLNILASTNSIILTAGSSSDTGARVFAKLYNTSIAAVRTTAGDYSSKLIKTDINNIEEEDIYNFIETVEVKKYFNNLTNKEEISIIIEDEQNKNNSFINFISEKDAGIRFDHELPNYLKEYENNPDIIHRDQRTKDEELYNIYTLEIPILKLKEYTSATLAATKLNHNRIKQLEIENEQLKARLDTIEAKLKD